jgi:NAD(P)-dependent dehydrogenase (short-subunit alcohol dehydrogenase family)
MTAHENRDCSKLHKASMLLYDKAIEVFSSMQGRFTDKTILVAGGTGGLGRAVTQAFLEEGANVVVTYRKQEEFDALNNPPRLEGYATDVTDEGSVRELVEKIIARHARLDALVNTVGGYVGGIKFWEAEAKVFEQMLALNVRSGYTLCRAIIPVMLRQQQGSVVNVAAKAGIDHPAGAGAYAASKAAAVALIDSLAADLKGTGVRVNSILPSVIDTEPNRRAMPKADFTRWPKPEEIARVILFLCSDEAKVIQGAAIPVYGDS